MDKEDLDRVAAGLVSFYQLIADSMSYMKKPRDYGTGEPLNMVEMHTLLLIVDCPGICITDVSKRWGNTLGAASRNVNRLWNKGYVRKEKLPGNDKNIHLFATDKGRVFAEMHKEYDKEEVRRQAAHILSCHSPEEFATFLSVLDSVREIVQSKTHQDSLHSLGSPAFLGQKTGQERP